ncbi:MAG: S41 family peptidase [Pseudomonadota bacterium]
MSAPTVVPVAGDEDAFSRAELIEDFDAGLAFIKETHPDLSYSANLADLDAQAALVREKLADGATAREAWAQMALMNPLFADAHVGFRRPVAALEKYEEAGGALFPLPIVIGADGTLRAAASGPGVQQGDAILAINGVPADKTIAYFTPRMRGETPELGRLVMQLYFPVFYWVKNGGFEDYSVLLQKENGARATVRLADATAYAPTGDDFSYETLDDRVGYLQAKTFSIERLEEFRAFLEGAFAAIEADGVEDLIIDVRANGGGATDLSELLLFYLTDQPFSVISSVKARITEDNIQLVPVDGVEVGMALDLPLQQTVTPPADLANRFDGDVYVLTGKMSYSATIVFATTIQDYGLGQIAGEAPLGPANQTGQVQIFEMPNTGLEALAPLYIFRRPNADQSRARIIVDIPIADDPFDPSASVEALRARIKQ